MKKLTSITALAAVIFALFYFTNTANAEKAAWGFTVSGQVSFNITDMDGATSVKVEVRNQATLDPYQTVTSLGNITTTGNYTRTAQQMYDQFGSYGSFYARLMDNNNSSHYSHEVSFTLAP